MLFLNAEVLGDEVDGFLTLLVSESHCVLLLVLRGQLVVLG